MEFQLTIDKEREEAVLVFAHEPSPLTEEIENLVRSYGGKDYLTAYDGDGLIRLRFSDVDCVTVRDRKLWAISADGKTYRLKKTLSEVEEFLPSYFVRINKSAVANQNRIARFKTTFNGAVDAVFQSGYTDYVSRRCLAELKRRMIK
jgi:DNA-binding LytR/AlgR family response regulator